MSSRSTHEGALGTMLQGRVVHRHQAGEMPMIVPAIEASASVTGFHEFIG
jgi:proline racemase